MTELELDAKFMGAQNADVISEKVRSILGSRSRIRLLEAGCGSASYFNFGSNVDSVGIDISPEQLERNAFIREKILGDIQTYPLAENQFDVVVCWDVIEHLSTPRQAILNMLSALKSNGVLVLGFPNLLSFKGLATKCTPYWCHRLAYLVMRYQSRPFPTYFRLAIAPNRILHLAQDNGFLPVYANFTEGGFQRRVRDRFPPISWLLSLVNGCLRIATAGKAPCLFHDHCALVLQRRRAEDFFGSGRLFNDGNRSVSPPA